MGRFRGRRLSKRLGLVALDEALESSGQLFKLPIDIGNTLIVLAGQQDTLLLLRGAFGGAAGKPGGYTAAAWCLPVALDLQIPSARGSHDRWFIKTRLP